MRRKIFLIYLAVFLTAAIVPQFPAIASEPIILWTYKVGFQPIDIKSGDLNGDSRPDVVIGYSEDKIPAIDSNGDLLWEFNTKFWVWHLAVGDINGDGVNDVAGYEAQDPGFLYAIDNSGSELWSYDLPRTGSGNEEADHIKIGDVNGDDKNEVVVGPDASDKLFVFDHQGSILLEYNYGTDPPSHSGIPSVELADISGDTTQDIIFSYGYRCPPCGIRVIDDEGTTIWDFPTSNRLGEAEVGDLNNDGNLDVVVSEWPGDTLYAIDNSGSLLWTYTLSDSAYSFGFSLNDVNGDGELDVVVGNATSPELYLLDSKANLIWTFDTGGGIGPIDVGDLNGDGELEIAFGSWSGTVPIEKRGIYAIDSNGDPIWFFQLTKHIRDLLVTDLNQDGGDEVVAISDDEFIYALSTKVEFVDVPPGYWAEDAIYKIYDKGITTGCSKDPLMFCPKKTVNRDQMAVFLGRATHDSNFTPPSATGIFADVPVWYWAADWIEQFYADGLTKGCKIDPHDVQSPVIYYCPKYPVTRTTMAIFLLRAKHGANYEPPPATGIFGDVWVNYWAADWIEQLYIEGITKGCKQNPLMYCPSNHVTRAQMAVFLARMLGL